MTIGINGFEAVVPRFGYDRKTGLPNRVGSGQYCYELLTSLNKIDRENNYIIYLPQGATYDLPKERENWHYKIVKPRKLWTLFGLSLEFLMRRSKVDVFFSPTHYLPLFVSVSSTISILDLSYIHFPELFKKKDLIQLNFWTKYSVKKTRRIFTISQASKDDIIKTYGVAQDKVIVTYPGVKSEIINSKSQINSKFKMQNSKLLKDKYGIQRQYILFVGTLQPRKNIVRLIQAFAKISNLKSQTSNLQLVIVGKKGWMWKEILEAPKKLEVEKRVRFLHNVSDEDLPVFYKNAICFILPSLYEGFGLPILEAMKYGCPVITSNVSSLPEAGGDAALYFNPLDVSDIKNKIEQVLEDKELKRQMIEKGYEQVKKFSWEKTARKTLEVLQELSMKK